MGDDLIKNRITIVIGIAVIIIVFFFAYLWVSGIITNTTITQEPSKNSTPDVKENGFGLNQLPIEVGHEIRNYKWKYNFTIDKWNFDDVNKSEILLYAHDFRNESSVIELQGKKIGNYSIRIIHDTEFETIRDDVFNYLLDLQKKPDYQIAYISMITDSSVNPTSHIAEVAVFKLTPENEKLNNRVINGWEIKIGIISSLPITHSLSES